MPRRTFMRAHPAPSTSPTPARVQGIAMLAPAQPGAAA